MAHLKQSLSVISLALLLTCYAQANTFRNAYISFEIQDSWDCKQELPQWICRSKDPQEAKEAVIILTAKVKGPADSFALYEAHMNASITTTNKAGLPMSSRVVYKAQQNRYNDQPWLDGLHQDSEVKHYFTRYLATVKGEIAILVTFSAHNKFYAKHAAHFMDTIRSLRVIAEKDLLAGRDGVNKSGSGESFGASTLGNPDLLGNDSDNSSQPKKNSNMMIGIGLLILALLIYIGIKVYQKRNDF